MTPFHPIPDALSPDACEAIIALAAAGPMKDAGLVRQTTEHRIRRAEIAWLDDLEGGAWVMERMVALVARANREAFGFDLSELGESAQIARYRADHEGHFDWHSDIGAGAAASRRKLSVVIQLSDPADYDGGALEIWPDSHVRSAPRARGQATVFPSFALHRVTPVTRGTRWSLTLWAHGPAFR